MNQLPNWAVNEEGLRPLFFASGVRRGETWSGPRTPPMWSVHTPASADMLEANFAHLSSGRTLG